MLDPHSHSFRVYNLSSLHNLDIPRIAEEDPGPTREDVVYAERGHAEYKGTSKKLPRPCSINLLQPDLQRAVYLLVKLNALRNPATKSLYMASHRPGGIFSISRAQLKHMRNCLGRPPARPHSSSYPKRHGQPRKASYFSQIAGDAFSYIQVRDH
jgi:hypothetical protein